jgi:diguanylate cyclase (GGDEF)-like protein
MTSPVNPTHPAAALSHRRPVHRIPIYLTAATLVFFALRLLFLHLFPPAAASIDYATQTLATIACAIAQFVVMPRHLSPSLRLRWVLWIVYFVVRAHLIALAAFGPIMPPFPWMRNYILAAQAIEYSSLLLAIATPSFSKATRAIRAIEVGLSVLLLATFLVVRMRFHEGGSQLHYFVFIVSYQAFLVLSALLATRAATSIAEHNLSRRIAAYAVALLLTSALVNFLTLRPPLTNSPLVDTLGDFDLLTLLLLTARGFTHPAQRPPLQATYLARTGLPLLVTLAIVGLGIDLVPTHPLFAILAILIAILAFGFRSTLLIGHHLVAQDHLLEDRTSLRRLVYLDPLTGAGNRRSFERALAEQWLHHIHHGGAFSLLLFDIDKFKDLNDTLGHPFGDTCLQLVANIVQRTAVRAGDHLARFGGDEFALILSRTDAPGATHLAAAIQQTLAQATLGYTIPFTISIGIATSRSPAQTPNAVLIAAADQALYLAKKAGGATLHYIEPIPED